jgi:hypothetical protein
MRMIFPRTEPPTPLFGPFPCWYLTLLGAVAVCLLIVPTGTSDRSVSHLLTDGTRVTHRALAHTYGWPLPWLYWGKPAWIAAQGSATAGASDAQIRGFVDQERVEWANYPLHCGLDRTLLALAIRQERAQFEADPRASVVAVSWMDLGANGVAGLLIGCGSLYAWGRWKRHARRRRRSQGRCAACGYDLRGNVSGRCPECGEAV